MTNNNNGTSLSALFGTAADRIETDGWTRTSWGTSINGPTCAEGALAKAAVLTTTDTSTLAAAMAVLQHVVGGYIPAWNDAKKRRKSEVVGVLRACALASQAAEDAATAPIAALASSTDNTANVLSAIDAASWEREQVTT